MASNENRIEMRLTEQEIANAKRIAAYLCVNQEGKRWAKELMQKIPSIFDKMLAFFLLTLRLLSLILNLILQLNAWKRYAEGLANRVAQLENEINKQRKKFKTRLEAERKKRNEHKRFVRIFRREKDKWKQGTDPEITNEGI